jgi:hypothetical protein
MTRYTTNGRMKGTPRKNERWLKTAQSLSFPFGEGDGGTVSFSGGVSI